MILPVLVLIPVRDCNLSFPLFRSDLLSCMSFPMFVCQRSVSYPMPGVQSCCVVAILSLEYLDIHASN